MDNRPFNSRDKPNPRYSRPTFRAYGAPRRGKTNDRGTGRDSNWHQPSRDDVGSSTRVASPPRRERGYNGGYSNGNSRGSSTRVASPPRRERDYHRGYSNGNSRGSSMRVPSPPRREREYNRGRRMYDNRGPPDNRYQSRSQHRDGRRKFDNQPRRGRGRRKRRGRRRQETGNNDYRKKYDSLSGRDKAIFKKHHHIQQCIQYDGIKVSRKEFEGSDRILQPTDPQKPYVRRKNHEKTVLHWGQRKLLLSEIEFLTLHSSTDVNIVIYAGAAPGAKSNYLSKLFPHCHFILVDPAPFLCHETDRLKINPDSDKGFFTDALAEFYRKKHGGRILFISDIRTASWKQMDENKIEEHVMNDMNSQMRWVEIMNPVASLLKFRLPYGNPSNHHLKEVTYLDGQIYLPVWGPKTTTEARLLVTDPTKKRSYNHLHYEGQMFYFNTVKRTSVYDHCLLSDPRSKEIGLDGCFDCTSEVHICKNYLQTRNAGTNRRVTNDDIILMIQEIDRNSAKSGRRLIDGNIKLSGLGATVDDKRRLDNLLSLDVAKESDFKGTEDDRSPVPPPPPPPRRPKKQPNHRKSRMNMNMKMKKDRELVQPFTSPQKHLIGGEKVGMNVPLDEDNNKKSYEKKEDERTVGKKRKRDATQDDEDEELGIIQPKEKKVKLD